MIPPTYTSSKMRSLLIIVGLIAAVFAEPVSYDGYKVYRLQPTQEEHLRLIAELHNNRHVDFWSSPRQVDKPVDIMVGPHAQYSITTFLERVGIKYDTLIENVELTIVQEQLYQILSPKTQLGRISFTKYNRHSEVNAYLDQLAQTHSDIVSVESIGKSYEGRDMKVIRISTDPSANKPVIYVDGGIHAREWIAPAQALYIINQLVENPSNAALLEKVDWHILPVVNPDGYEYTHVNDRYWRKTRSLNTRCYGADPNRNFGYHWGETGASANECDETYRGRSAFSEVETQHVRDDILAHQDRIKLYLTFHSYGEYLLYPWGFTSALPSDADELHSLGEAVANAIYNVAGTVYTVGSSTNVLYAAAGGSDDWAKGIAGVQLSYTIELPGGGWTGFDPPATQIVPMVTETWQGVKVYHQYIEQKFA